VLDRDAYSLLGAACKQEQQETQQHSTHPPLELINAAALESETTELPPPVENEDRDDWLSEPTDDILDQPLRSFRERAGPFVSLFILL
jgi:hypothetical protein